MTYGSSPPPPAKKSSGGAIALGCGIALLLIAILGVGAAMAWFVIAPQGGGGGSSVFSSSSKEDGVKIKYARVKDSKTGPSRVKPSGKRSKSIKKRNGVIHTSAKQITLKTDIGYPDKPAYCKGTENATDFIKDIVFDFDRQLRKQSPISEKEEVELGDMVAKQILVHPKFKGKIDTRNTAKWRAYLARVAQPLLAEIKRKGVTYKFHVIDMPIVNAFAIPGGHVYFFTGMLENKGGRWLENEAQLAGILAHEISHIDLGHTIAVYQYLKQFGLGGSQGTKPAQIALTLARHPFSSNQEDEADTNATRLMTRAQYDPSEFVTLWKNWAKAGRPQGKIKGKKKDSADPVSKELQNLLRSHSAPQKRACNVMKKTNLEVESSRFDRFYVGEKNYKKKRPRTREQY